MAIKKNNTRREKKAEPKLNVMTQKDKLIIETAKGVATLLYAVHWIPPYKADALWKAMRMYEAEFDE